MLWHVVHGRGDYGKKRHCHAANLCRALLHGKDIFAVRSKQHARQGLSAAHGNKSTHGKVSSGARQRIYARQSLNKAHHKETTTVKSLHAARQRL
jgi:hypothetical protein